MEEYLSFLDRRAQAGADAGFRPEWVPEFLFPFQKDLLEWATRRGRAAIFADCGLGKTPMQLVWAENIVRKTGGRVLILTPLAVSHQTIREAQKFGIVAHRSHSGELFPGINVTNYEQLHYYGHADFAAVVCDESSILKSFDGVRRGEITDFMRKVPYRLLATATAAPNDYIELGTSSEALGYLGHLDMLQRFFKNDQNTVKPQLYRHRGANFEVLQERVKWRFKGHAETPFWRWVCSWARAMRRPSDLGHDDAGFILPPLEERTHIVEANTLPEGFLFDLPAFTMPEQREVRRRTIRERCEMAAALVADTGQPALVWCHLNPEGDLLERMIPDAIQVSGSDPNEVKEERFIAFASGQARVLVTKPKIGAWGLNFQHCAHVVMFPSHSFEQYYQGIRRCWRFGQTRPVVVDIVSTNGELAVLENLYRKAEAADRMFSSLVAEMNRAQSIKADLGLIHKEEVPSWL